VSGMVLFGSSETNRWYCSDAFTRLSSPARSKIVRWVKRSSRRAELKANGRRALLDVWSVKSFGLEFLARIKQAHRSRKQWRQRELALRSSALVLAGSR
jgi:hypothetical protein